MYTEIKNLNLLINFNLYINQLLSEEKRTLKKSMYKSKTKLTSIIVDWVSKRKWTNWPNIADIFYPIVLNANYAADQVWQNSTFIGKFLFNLIP